MEIEGTFEAFSKAIVEKGVYKKLDVNRSTVSEWKSSIKGRKTLTIDKMEEILLKLGYKVKSEKVWVTD